MDMNLLDVVVKIIRREESDTTDTPSGNALFLADANGAFLKTADGFFLAAAE